MIPIKVKKKKINLATYAMFDLLSKNALMEAKNLENYLKDLWLLLYTLSFSFFFSFLS